MRHKTRTMLLLLAAVASGCSLLAQTATLQDGLYQMETDIRKPRVDRNYGGVEECRVTVQGGKIRVDALGAHSNAWYEGAIEGGHIAMSTHFEKLDPMLQAMQLRDLWKGDVQPDGSVKGTMESYTGTNKFMSGMWILKKRK